MLPVRKSVWEDPACGHHQELGQLPRGCRQPPANTRGNFYTVSPQMVTETGPWVIAIQQTILGEKTAKDALDQAVEESEKMLKEPASTEAGLYKKKK